MKNLFITIIFFVVLTFEAKSQTTLTIGEVYNYEINDEFHYKVFSPNITPNAKRFTIVDKYFSANNDSIFYIRHHDNYSSHVIWTWDPYPYCEYYFYSYIDTLIITNLDTLISKQFEYISKDDTVLESWVHDTTFFSSEQCGI